MIVYDKKTGQKKEGFTHDPELGELKAETIPVWHRWIVDKPAVMQEQVVAEYPETGGKDIEYVVVEPEEGHWQTYDANGDVVKDYDGEYDEKWPHGTDGIYGEFTYGLYTPYTAEEIEKRRKEKEEADRELEEAQKKAEEREKFLVTAPKRIDVLESGVDDSYDAIAELGVEVADHSVTLDDIMDAIAELGQIVEEQNG